MASIRSSRLLRRLRMTRDQVSLPDHYCLVVIPSEAKPVVIPSEATCHSEYPVIPSEAKESVLIP